MSTVNETSDLFQFTRRCGHTTLLARAVALHLYTRTERVQVLLARMSHEPYVRTAIEEAVAELDPLLSRHRALGTVSRGEIRARVHFIVPGSKYRSRREPIAIDNATMLEVTEDAQRTIAGLRAALADERAERSRELVEHRVEIEALQRRVSAWVDVARGLAESL